MNKNNYKKPEWLGKLKPYEKTSLLKAIVQIVTSFGGFLGIMAAMYFLISNEFPYWMSLLLSVVAGAFYTRIFILFHDCCHYSFFKSRTACNVLGHFFGAVVFTPYHDWQKAHNYHHATSGNLEKRGTGDIDTMTVTEYKNSTKSEKLRYRIMRNPLFLFGLVPVLLFLVLNRFPSRNSGKKEVMSVLFTNLFVVSLFAAAHFTIGLKTYFLIHGPVFFFGSTLGVWLFYIQHQFQDVYWAHEDKWDYYKAALEGSSYYKLNPVFNWLSGNIGFHHIHHLRAKIPNYNLQRCFRELKELQDVTPVTLKDSFRSLQLRLWDEKSGQLVSFSSVK